MRYDTIVIGAGMSGLAAGIRLAQYDRRVVVLERHAVWGGLNSFYSLGPHRFDVGLHALTNWAPAPRSAGAAKGARGRPLTLLLRQLRIRHEELRLGEQRGSELRFPGLRLRFTNDVRVLEEEVARAFPRDADGFRRLVSDVGATPPEAEPPADGPGARAVLGEYLRDPLLIELLLLPVSYYGSAREDDCDWYPFTVLFRSIFLEGLARPQGGIRTLLNLLVKRYRGLGGELRTKSGVRRVLARGGRCVGVELDSGETLEADQVLSSAGLVETLRMVDDPAVAAADAPPGRLSFLESIAVLDRRPADLGIDFATAFFSHEPRLRYRCPEGLVDVASGVLSCPDNFAAEVPPREPQVRLTVLANHGRWRALLDGEGRERYAEEKARAAAAATASAAELFPDWRPHVTFQDVFTPTTIQRYTGHEGGAIYGSPSKRWSGETPLSGLFLCGTDQGYLGIVGALLSGVTMANRHVLSRSTSGAR